jgi:hypothetical protein
MGCLQKLHNSKNMFFYNRRSTLTKKTQKVHTKNGIELAKTHTGIDSQQETYSNPMNSWSHEIEYTKVKKTLKSTKNET